MAGNVNAKMRRGRALAEVRHLREVILLENLNFYKDKGVEGGEGWNEVTVIVTVMTCYCISVPLLPRVLSVIS